MRSIKWIAVAGTVLLLAPATSEAAMWRGKTQQGKVATVATGSAGKVKRAGFGYVARCRSGARLGAGTLYAPKRRIRTRGYFSSRGSYSFTVEGYRVRATAFSRGRLRASGLWTGDFRIKLRVYRGGRLVDRCRVGKTGWSARRVG